MLNINHHWYRTSFTWLTFLLLPLSVLFWLAVNFRRVAYWLGIKKKYHFETPVIVVGNITVGGTGKTPFVIWLAKLLQAQGFRPGIVSRGYGGKEFLTAERVDALADPRRVGDEAVLLARRANCPVMVSTNRVAAVQALLAETDCNVVISDDGLQHYRMARQLEIVIVDGERRFGNQYFLPAGPLRESLSRLKKVDFVISQHGNTGYNMELSGEFFLALDDSGLKKSLHEFASTPVHAVAAIGNPSRFFNTLRKHGLQIIEHSFPDHYQYKNSDLDFGDDLPILMTEKDAVKCQDFANNKFWYLPVEATLDENFTTALLNKINAINIRGENHALI
jgi:tetraacyldisaccharide 4'-kinase